MGCRPCYLKCGLPIPRPCRFTTAMVLNRLRCARIITRLKAADVKTLTSCAKCCSQMINSSVSTHKPELSALQRAWLKEIGLDARALRQFGFAPQGILVAASSCLRRFSQSKPPGSGGKASDNMRIKIRCQWTITRRRRPYRRRLRIQLSHQARKKPHNHYSLPIRTPIHSHTLNRSATPACPAARAN